VEVEEGAALDDEEVDEGRGATTASSGREDEGRLAATASSLTPSLSSLSLFFPFPLFLFPLPSTSERLTGVAPPDTAGLPATRRDPRGTDEVEGGRDEEATASGRGCFSF